MPPVDRLFVCKSEAGTTWLVLEGDYLWSQPQNPEDAAAETPRHTIWAQIRSYLVDATDAELWTRWANGQDWYGRWMPESGSPTGLLLADHPYKSEWPNLDVHDGPRSGHQPLPGTLVVATTRYGGVSDWDQSAGKHLYTYLPSTTFCSALGLKRVGEAASPALARWAAEQAIRSAEVTHAHPEGIAGAIVVAVAAAGRLAGRGEAIPTAVPRRAFAVSHRWPAPAGRPAGSTAPK